MSAPTTTPSDAGRVDFGYQSRTLRLGSRFAVRVRARELVVCTVLAVVTLALAIVATGVGDYPLSPLDVINALIGVGPEFARMIVIEWRLPIVVAAMVFGALLGTGGAIFQSLTRNPLGSPDIIGFDAGSYTAVVITMLVLGNHNYWTIAGASIVGGLITAFAVYLLAYRKGVQGFRLIIVGIGVTAMLGSVDAYLITRANVEEAMSVGFWGAGSLARVSWESMIPSLVLAAALFALAAVLANPLRQMELGDDAAKASGVNVNAARLTLMVVGVATGALVTAAAGPIGFIALVAPQVARRITHSAGVTIAGAAFTGAALLTGAHCLGLLVASLYRPVPVGLLTVCLGGVYLIWLLIKETRQKL